MDSIAVFAGDITGIVAGDIASRAGDSGVVGLGAAEQAGIDSLYVGAGLTVFAAVCISGVAAALAVGVVFAVVAGIVAGVIAGMFAGSADSMVGLVVVCIGSSQRGVTGESFHWCMQAVFEQTRPALMLTCGRILAQGRGWGINWPNSPLVL